jgi:hypothetical protein
MDSNPHIDPQLSSHSPIHFPRLPGETNANSFLTNPFNDNFESGPLDTFSDFNFAGEEILSFLNPPHSNLIDGEIMSLSTTGDPESMESVLLHHHDYSSWLHLNRDENTSPHSNASCGVLAETASTPLIEPGESKEMFVPQDKPKSSFAIDEENYARLQEKLDVKYKVFFPNVAADVEISPLRFRVTESTIIRTVCLLILRLFLSPLPNHPSPNIQSRQRRRYYPFNVTESVPLLLSMCCIGALYSMEKVKSQALFEQSRRIVDMLVFPSRSV